MRLSLQTLVEELQRLKLAGQNTVSVSEESLNKLRHAVNKHSLTEAAAEPPPAPSPARPPLPAGRPAPATAANFPSARPTAASPSSTPSPQPSSGKNSPTTAADYTDRKPTAPASGPSVLEAFLSGNTKAASAAPKSAQTSPANRLPEPPEFHLPEGDKATRLAWLLEKARNDYTAKTFVRPGKRPVLGSGNLDASLFFIGEAPTIDDENETPPQAGSPGELLARMIQGMGLSRDQVFIANIMTWRAHGIVEGNGPIKDSRDPNLHEMAYCMPYLKAQIDIIRPRILIGFGATAAKGLLGPGFKTLFDARGQWHSFHELPLMVTYHPNYLLHKASEGKAAEKKAKRSVWEDLLKVMERGELPISEKQRAYFL